MSKVIALSRAAAVAHKVEEARLEVIRTSLVCTCALALIAAGRAFPF